MQGIELVEVLRGDQVVILAPGRVRLVRVASGNPVGELVPIAIAREIVASSNRYSASGKAVLRIEHYWPTEQAA